MLCLPIGGPTVIAPWFHSMLTFGPTMNHSPAASASRPPNIMLIRVMPPIRIRPPTTATIAGSTSSQNRSANHCQCWFECIA